MSGDETDRYYGTEPTLPLPPNTSVYGRGGRPARPAKAGGGPGGPPRARRFALILLVLVLLFVGVGLGTWFWASSKITKVGPLADYAGRPAQGVGTNWLVVGSDSRSNVTAQQKVQYHLGSDQGQRTDTIMLLHYGAGGPDLVSIPRDSYVTIPGYTDPAGRTHGASKNKVNAAYDFGGAPLLVQTVELATGVRIDHYLEIGFLGVVDVVDSVGGVHLCLGVPVKDGYSGADLPAGCQTLDGQQSLALIRSRYSLANSDISRMANQQKFVAGLVHSVLRPGVLLNPFTLYPFLSSSLASTAVDDGTGLSSLVELGRHASPLADGKATAGTVPIANENHPVSGVGSTVQWDSAKARQVFAAIGQDTAIPAGLLNSLR